MPDLPSAQTLAAALKRTAELCGLNIRIAITDMDQPLGSCVGNALEVREAIAVLQGQPSRFANLCIRLAGLALSAAGLAQTREEGEVQASDAIATGKAANKAREWFAAQGATVDVFAHPDSLPTASTQFDVLGSEAPGWISGIDAQAVGHAVVHLGGGRLKKSDDVEPSVGIQLHVEVGSYIEPGQPLMTIFARSHQDAAKAQAALKDAFMVSKTKVEHRDPIIAVL
jgi:thymidine phosphorylase